MIQKHPLGRRLAGLARIAKETDEEKMKKENEEKDKEVKEEKKMNAKKNADALAKLEQDALKNSFLSVELSTDKVARGKARYGSN